jgi:hypothetical protein
MSGSEEETPSAPDGDTGDASSASSLVPKPKLWRLSETNVYLDTLLVKAMVDCLEGERTNTGWVLTNLIDQYHLEMRNETENKRPKDWKVGEYLTHSAFKTEIEWKQWDAAAQLNGVASEKRPDTGLGLAYKRWATLKYDKWQLIKRDILNNTHSEWVRLFPIPSGCSGKQEMKEKLKLVLFKKWMMAPTKKGGHANYKAFPMPLDFLPFNTWDLWCEIGPGGGSKKSSVFIDECCTPIAKITPGDGASAHIIPDDITRLNVAYDSKTQFESRDAGRQKSKILPRPAEFSSPRSVDVYKRNRQTQQDNIARLTLLSTSKHATDAERLKYDKELFEYLKHIQNTFSEMKSPAAPASPISVVAVSPSVAPATPATPPPLGIPGPCTQSLLREVSSSSKHLLGKFDTQLCDALPQTDSAQIISAADSERARGGTTILVDIPIFAEKMGYSEYLQWLKCTHSLKESCVVSDGMCLFSSALLCIQQLKVFSGKLLSGNDDVYKPEPILDALIRDWSTVTASVFKEHILTLMKSVLGASFDALTCCSFQNFSEAILDEGREYGIVDYDLRDTGKPPALFDTTDEFFRLMASPGAYGSDSSILAISIFCNVAIHVWVYGKDLPDIYGSYGNNHYISLVKKCRSSHFDALVGCNSVTHNYDAKERWSVVIAEDSRRNREASALFAINAARERETQKEKKIAETAASLAAEEKRNQTQAAADQANAANKAADAITQPDIVAAFLVDDPVAALSQTPTAINHVQPEASSPVDNRDFSRYHYLSARILTWKTEYDVCMFSEKEGRGLLNYVPIDDGNPIHRYGGDRVHYSIGQGPKSFVRKGDHNPQKQRNGEVKFRPAQVARLFAKYPQLDRSQNDNIPFHPTHAVQLGTHHPKHWKVTVCATAFMLIIDYLFRFRIGSLSTAFRCVTLASTKSPMSTGWDWLRPIVRKTSTWCVNG